MGNLGNIMKINKNKWNNTILYIELFILGIFSFSLINRYFWINVCKLSLTFPEVFWILFVLINIKRYIKDISIICNKKFLILCALVFGMILYSIARGGNLVLILSYMQSIFEIIFFAIIFMDYENVDVDKLWWLCFGAVCGDVFYLVFLSGETYETVNHIAWVSCCITSFLAKGKYKIILTYVLCFVGAVLSGFRINIILVLVALLTCTLWELFRKRENGIKSFLWKISITIILVGGNILLYNNLLLIIKKIADVFNFNGEKIFRIVTRLQMFFSGDSISGTDSVRMEFIKLIFTEFDNHILPTGLIYGPVFGKTGYYVDTPLLLFYEIFGSVVTWAILLFLAYCSIRLIIASLRDIEIKKEYVFAALTVPCATILLVLNGMFVISNYSAAVTGILIGIIIRYTLSSRKYHVIKAKRGF
ncbi:MAG: hypothetical protein ACI4EW_11455 [Butyrivibrio sp.]